MKNERLMFVFNLLLATSSLFIFIDALDKALWRSLFSGVGTVVFMTFAVLLLLRVIKHNKVVYK